MTNEAGRKWGQLHPDGEGLGRGQLSSDLHAVNSWNRVAHGGLATGSVDWPLVLNTRVTRVCQLGKYVPGFEAFS